MCMRKFFRFRNWGFKSFIMCWSSRKKILISLLACLCHIIWTRVNANNWKIKIQKMIFFCFSCSSFVRVKNQTQILYANCTCVQTASPPNMPWYQKIWKHFFFDVKKNIEWILVLANKNELFIIHPYVRIKKTLINCDGWWK